MLRAGVELYEYQPQVLHAKLFIVNDAVYVGSANLDPRSLLLNYELMTRFESASTLEPAGKLFDELLRHSQRIERAEWRKARTWWAKLKERFASFLLSRVDPYLSLRQWRSLPE
jgi:cardiolipin synthase